jgi:alginate O-acetyltransferase complex protein AlgI
MLFNSIDFWIFFIIVIASMVVIRNRSYQHVILLVASYFLFYYTSNYLITLLIASTILDFYVGKSIAKSNKQNHKKILLLLSLSGNLGLLGFFKYADFAIGQFNEIGRILGFNGNIPFLELALPIGISFYTFQTISYTVDIYRGKLEPCKSLREFALFVTFFPQLVAGPIVRASEFLPQLREKISEQKESKLKLITIKSSNLKIGLTIMIFGFIKKMIFADNIADLSNYVFLNPIGLDSFSILLGTIAFGFQIYGDFSGYSDIAIGAAIILGFKLPINFNKPYFASSPSDFWRRWHISLSSWLKDYLYIPLGGNKITKHRTYLNLLTVMFLGGLWHGASWNFVIWGLLHGAYLAIHKIFLDRFPDSKVLKIFSTKKGKIISILVTQYFVFLAWIPFRVSETDMMLYSIYKYIVWDFQIQTVQEVASANKLSIFLIVVFLSIQIYLYIKPKTYERISKLSLKKWCIFLIISFSAIFFTYDSNPADFIYFRF